MEWGAGCAHWAVASGWFLAWGLLRCAGEWVVCSLARALIGLDFAGRVFAPAGE